MKNKLYFLIAGFGLLMAPYMSAQSIQPAAGTIVHNNAARPCLIVNVDPGPDLLKEAWRDFLKDNYDFKLKGIGFLSNKDLLSAEQVVVGQISSKEMDFYTYVIEDENGSEMKVFAAFGYDMYVDSISMPAEYEELKTILERFLRTYLPGYHQELVEETEKRISELSGEKEKLKRNITEGEKEIKRLKKEMESLSEEVEVNKEKLEKAERKLATRKVKLDRVLKQYNN
jgi:flagellar capping protein FliD